MPKQPARASPTAEAIRHVETTVPDETWAKRIAKTALEGRLAACAQWWPIRSQYWWDDALETTAEILLVFKTTLGRVAELQRQIQELHPYEVPYIATVQLSPVTDEYAAWTAREVRPRRSGPSRRQQPAPE